MFWVLRIALHPDLVSLQKMIVTAQTFPEWRAFGREIEDKLKWILRSRQKLYDKALVKEKTVALQEAGRAIQGDKELMMFLRLDMMRNFGNITKSKLHEHYFDAPTTIKAYVLEVQQQLKNVLETENIAKEDKLAFFRECRHVYGRTALVLSGGASLGTFHMGVVKALFDHQLLPRVISGTSAGAIVAAIACVRTDGELRETFDHINTLDIQFFGNNTTISLLQNFLKHGCLEDAACLTSRLRDILGDMTFREAFDRTGRVLNVSVSPAETNEDPRLLNYLTSPSVVIWSAVAASSAFPGLYPAQRILTKGIDGGLEGVDLRDGYGRKWRDGALQMDLPITTLSELFNCNFVMVSQCNPHLAPLLHIKRLVGNTMGGIIEMEMKNRCRQLQLLLPRWTKWLDLFAQDWEGDVTVVLPLSAMKLGKLITNPSVEDIIEAVKVGERQTWRHMWAIECHSAIEACLQACLLKLGEQRWITPVVSSDNVSR